MSLARTEMVFSGSKVKHKRQLSPNHWTKYRELLWEWKHNRHVVLKGKRRAFEGKRGVGGGMLRYSQLLNSEKSAFPSFLYVHSHEGLRCIFAFYILNVKPSALIGNHTAESYFDTVLIELPETSQGLLMTEIHSRKPIIKKTISDCCNIAGLYSCAGSYQECHKKHLLSTTKSPFISALC